MIVDSSAVVAVILNEPGGNNVRRRITGGASISAVNLAEVVGVLRRNGMSPEAVNLAVGLLSLDVIPFDEALAFHAGLLELSTRRRGLSLGDRACLATALRHKLPILTADRAWQDLPLDVEIELFR